MKRQAKNQTQQQNQTTSSLGSGILQRKCACGKRTIAGGECAECRKKREAMMQHEAINSAPVSTALPDLQSGQSSLDQQSLAISTAMEQMNFEHDFSQVRASSDANGPPSQISSDLSLASAFTAIIQTAGSGRPLDQYTREAMEAQFGHDFSSVRIHNDNHAAQAAQLADAEAFTVGEHIFWGASQSSSAKTGEYRLLAHELVHVLQQRKAGLESTPLMNVKLVDDGSSEREAERIALDVSNSNTPIQGEPRTRTRTMPMVDSPTPIQVSTAPKTAQTKRKPGESFTDCVNNFLASQGIAGAITTMIWVTCGIIGGIAAFGGTLIEPGGGTLTALGAALASCIAIGTGFPIGVIIASLKDCAE